MIEFEETGEQNKTMYIARDASINLTLRESQFMFHRLVEKGHFGIFMADVKGYLFYVNHAFVAMLGYERKDDILGTNLAGVLYKDPGKRTEFLKKLNLTSFVRDFELQLTRRDGIDVILSVSANFNENESGRVIGIDGIVHDITDKNLLEEALLTEKQKMEQILEFSEVVSMIKEFDELIDCVVQRVAKVLEAQKCSVMLIDEQNENLMVVGAKGMDEKIAKNVRMKLGEPIAGVVAGDGNPLLVKNIEYDSKFQRANRPMYFGRSFIIVPLKIGGRVKGVINVSDKILKKNLHKGSKLNYEEFFNEIDLRILCAISREVSVALENVRLFEELNSLAVTDPLTHIYNYRQFSKSLDYEIKRCRRSECSLSIIMIDLDDLKVYNDTFGHLEGDALLKNLGKIFKDQLREVDIVCRYAGDEFAIILPDTDLEGAQQAAQKIKNAVNQFKFKKEVTLSYGIAKYGDKLSQYDLVQKADKALYSAKQAGKNCIRVYQE